MDDDILIRHGDFMYSLVSLCLTMDDEDREWFAAEQRRSKDNAEAWGAFMHQCPRAALRAIESVRYHSPQFVRAAGEGEDDRTLPEWIGLDVPMDTWCACSIGLPPDGSPWRPGDNPGEIR